MVKNVQWNVPLPVSAITFGLRKTILQQAPSSDIPTSGIPIETTPVKLHHLLYLEPMSSSDKTANGN